jgi:TetR/AcrR family transcriptional repressor of bet genes
MPSGRGVVSVVVAETRREQIVDGLCKVMARRGYERASILQIARAAGLTPGLLHYHFKSKEHILVALVERLAGQLHARVEARIGGARAPRERIGRFIDVHLDLDDADPDALACWVAIGAEAVLKPAVRRIYAGAIDEDRAVLLQLVQDALHDEGRPLMLGGAIASAILAAIQGMYQLAATAPDVVPPGTAASSVRRMADGLLGSEARRRGGRS